VSPDDQPDLDPALADAVRRAYVRPVDEVTATRHVSAMVAASGASEKPATAPARLRRRAWRPALAATAATLLLPVGLAAAGVTLPEAVEKPYEVVGISLPNQPRDVRPAPAVTPLTPATTPSTPAPSRSSDARARRTRAERVARRRAQQAADRRDRSRVGPKPRSGAGSGKLDDGLRKPADRPNRTVPKAKPNPKPKHKPKAKAKVESKRRTPSKPPAARPDSDARGRSGGARESSPPAETGSRPGGSERGRADTAETP